MKTTSFTMPYLPGILHSSRATLDPGASVQVREIPTTEGSQFLVGIAHCGQYPGIPVNENTPREWQNLAVTVESDDSDTAFAFAQKVHACHLDSYEQDMLEAVEWLKSATPGNMNPICAIAAGRKFGSVTAFLTEAANRYQAHTQDILDEIAHIVW